MTSHLGKAVADHGPRHLSPIDHLDRGLPPTIVFRGTADEGRVTCDSRMTFCRRARASKAQCEVVLYPGAPHGFTEIWLGLENASYCTENRAVGCGYEPSYRRISHQVGLAAGSLTRSKGLGFS